MRRVSAYDKDGFLTMCTVVVDCDNMRVGVFITDEELVRATTDLALSGILYHVTVYQIPSDERPHRRAVQSGYLTSIRDNWLKDPNRVAYYRWLVSQRDARLDALRVAEKYAQRLAELQSRYTPDMRERYED